MKCQKALCMKQVNPDVPGVYFGEPFEYDPNWLACVFCMGEKPITKPILLKRKEVKE